MINRTSPMDRLVCGDVGFGKTEVAIRTAYRAVLAGYQVLHNSERIVIVLLFIIFVVNLFEYVTKSRASNKYWRSNIILLLIIGCSSGPYANSGYPTCTKFSRTHAGDKVSGIIHNKSHLL